ncbi:MAG: PfkB family carbohydrate kinase [Saprospiraceae bacterium]|jgi:sugar/nucleoside kinase (ribokinase family)|nr:PfkB family carbohydrate kinase [Saprospiraceae bacterium]MDA9866493.1 PfkB family carbohydrate kinase [Saprospiraceae bacterium]MDB9914941.1 PfkB family carbohydrate kinase [Saprospiraceae bacterium]|tara:strand:- start:149 stop:1057 length:909 start_codon:yes stop_codon:yes gene_type:complete
MSLLTIGTLAFDTIETPHGKADMVIGGSCTYISHAASYFTNNINLSAIVGGDFPQEEIKALEDKGVNMEGLQIKADGKTFFWAGKYHEDMNQRDTLVTDLNVLEDFDPQLPESYKSSKYVMLGNLTPDIQNSVLDQLDGSQKLVAMDTMNFWIDIALDSLKKAIARVDILTINDEEARMLTGEYSLVNAAAAIHKMGPKYLVIKKGEHGCLLFSEGNMFYAPAMPLAQVFDPTGAGDTFAGGFMGYLAKTDDISFDNMKKAIVYGSAMASFCVEEFSIDRLKKLDQKQIDKRVEAFRMLMAF